MDISKKGVPQGIKKVFVVTNSQSLYGNFLQQQSVFLLQGGQGAPPSKTIFVPLKFSKNNRNNNRDNSLLF